MSSYSDRGRSQSPHPLNDGDVDMGNENIDKKEDTKVVIATNLTRNVVESHLRMIFGFYGEIVRIDLPLFSHSGQNRGKAAIEFVQSSAAERAVTHLNGGQLDGAALKTELSTLPIYSHASRSRQDRPGVMRSLTRSLSRSPLRARRRGYEGYRGRGQADRRVIGARNSYRQYSASRSRSPGRRANYPLTSRRRSPSYERGGTGYRPRTSRSKSYSRMSSRSRSYSRSRSRSPSYSSYSRYSRSRSRSRSYSNHRSKSRDDIRDSRSRSPNGNI